MESKSKDRITADVSILEDLLYTGSVREICPYLPGKNSNLIFLDGESLGLAYRIMMDGGYRRYGRFLYRTDCPECFECKVIRIPVDEFKMSGSQKRIWKKGNSVFNYTIGLPERTDEKESLYKKYLAHQHATVLKPDESTDDGSSYDFFFKETFIPKNTKELKLYFNEKLCGIGIMDYVSDALSSVYFFFDPDIARFSPGTYTILLEINIARELGMKYYYPGFYIRDAKTMSYKSNFRPCYIRDRITGEWTPFADGM